MMFPFESAGISGISAISPGFSIHWRITTGASNFKALFRRATTTGSVFLNLTQEVSGQQVLGDH